MWDVYLPEIKEFTVDHNTSQERSIKFAVLCQRVKLMAAI